MLRRMRRSWIRLLCDIKRQAQLDAMNDTRMRRMADHQYALKGY